MCRKCSFGYRMWYIYAYKGRRCIPCYSLGSDPRGPAMTDATRLASNVCGAATTTRRKSAYYWLLPGRKRREASIRIRCGGKPGNAGTKRPAATPPRRQTTHFDDVMPAVGGHFGDIALAFARFRVRRLRRRPRVMSPLPLTAKVTQESSSRVHMSRPPRMSPGGRPFRWSYWAFTLGRAFGREGCVPRTGLFVPLRGKPATRLLGMAHAGALSPTPPVDLGEGVRVGGHTRPARAHGRVSKGMQIPLTFFSVSLASHGALRVSPWRPMALGWRQRGGMFESFRCGA